MGEQAQKEDLYQFTAKVHNNLAVTYAVRNKFNEAKGHFESALKINRALIEKCKMEDIVDDAVMEKEDLHALAMIELEAANNLCNIVSLFCDAESEDDRDIMID